MPEPVNDTATDTKSADSTPADSTDQLYDSVLGTRLHLTDHLAAVRSILANERTFLAYQRTAVTTFAAAASFIKFFDSPVLELVGWLLLPASVLTAALGAIRYRRMRNFIQQMENDQTA